MRFGCTVTLNLYEGYSGVHARFKNHLISSRNNKGGILDNNIILLSSVTYEKSFFSLSVFSAILKNLYFLSLYRTKRVFENPN